MQKDYQGTGTCTSPIAIDDSDDDSEVEVLNELTHRRGTSDGGSSPGYDPMQHGDDPANGEGSGYVNVREHFIPEQNNPWTDHANGFAERGMKRQRSESVTPRGSERAVSESRGQPSSGQPQAPAGESRKAKKRRRKAERNKELYLDRWRRLQDAPNLVPQFPPGMTPLQAANMNPFALLPQLHDSLLDINFPFPNYYAGGQWLGGQLGMYGHTAMPQQQQHADSWGFQDPNSQMDEGLNSATMTLTLEAPSTSATVGSHSLPAKPIVRPPPQIMHQEPAPAPAPAQPIGVEPDNDPNSKYGLFKIPETVLDEKNQPYLPTPACTLVLEQLPKSHRNSDFVTAWCRRACGVRPAKVLIDQSGAKALVEFPSSIAARAAFASPRLGLENLGLKSHQLKGRPREDLIKAFWYRVDGVSDGVGEIEEGEIQEATEKAVASKETKKDRKARLAKQREEKERARQRAREAAASLSAAAGPSGTSPMNWIPSVPLNPLPNGLPQRPSHLPAPPVAPYVGPTSLGMSPMNDNPPRLTIETGGPNVAGQENDDMDLSPDSPLSSSLPFNGDFPPQPPPAALRRGAPPFIPSTHPLPSGPRAMQNVPTEPTHHMRRKQQDVNGNGINGVRHQPKIMQQQHPLPRPPIQPHPPLTAPPALPAPPPPPPPAQPTVSMIPNATQAMEASLRERVLKSRLSKGKARESPPSISSTPSPTDSGPSTSEAPNKNTLDAVGLFTVDSFLATVPTSTPEVVKSPSPPPPGLTPATPAPPTRKTTSLLMEKKAELERLERGVAKRKQLMEQFGKATSKAEKDVILASLREMDREEEAAKAASASSAGPAATGPMRPSAKINLDYTMPPRPSKVAQRWTEDQSNEQHILIISDDEEDDDDDE